MTTAYVTYLVVLQGPINRKRVWLTAYRINLLNALICISASTSIKATLRAFIKI